MKITPLSVFDAMLKDDNSRNFQFASIQSRIDFCVERFKLHENRLSRSVNMSKSLGVNLPPPRHSVNTQLFHTRYTRVNSIRSSSNDNLLSKVVHEEHLTYVDTVYRPYNPAKSL